MPEVLRERRGHIEILTINRPEARNAVNGAVSRGIGGALDELETDDALREDAPKRIVERHHLGSWRPHPRAREKCHDRLLRREQRCRHKSNRW